MYRRWIRKHKSVPTKSMACTVHFSRFTAVTCCNPVLASICTSTKFHFQFQWTPISKLSVVAHVVHEQSFARQLQTVVSYELYDLNSEHSRCRCRCVNVASLQVDCISVNKDHLHAIKSVIFQRLRVILYLDRAAIKCRSNKNHWNRYHKLNKQLDLYNHFC